MWFKANDLRLQDHAPLLIAHSACVQVDHVFVLDPRHFRQSVLGISKLGPRRFSWLCECLGDLSQSLTSQGSSLRLLVGRPETVLPRLMSTLKANELYTHSEVAWEEQTVQRSVSASLGADHKLVESWGGGTLLEPSMLPFNAAESLPFFTSFRKQVEATNVIATLQPGPSFPPASGIKPQSSVAEDGGLEFVPVSALLVQGHKEELFARMLIKGSLETESFSGDANVGGCAVSSAVAGSAKPVPFGLNIVVDNPAVVDPRAAFPLAGGETAAHRRIDHYIANGHGRLTTYKETRNGLVGVDYSTKLSAYLASGCITARQVLHAIRRFETSPGGVANESTYWVIFELLWRDYMRFYGMRFGRKMFHLGGAQGRAGRSKWPWHKDESKFVAWQAGRTGYPVIDANMRELLLTGFMSNRGRQIVASFLVRDLELDWRLGAEHFESLLVDHDVCSNYGNWQYAAGVGADPREDRYFNIVKQAKDYDPACEHIRLWVPEAAHLPDRILLDPRQLTPAQRQQFNIDAAKVLPVPVCSLMMDRSPKFALPVAGAAGGGDKPRIKGGGGGKKGHQHGFVKGRPSR